MKHLKTAIKVLGTGLLLYIVARKTDLDFIQNQLATARLLPLAAAFLAYVLSRLLGAHRLRRLLATEGVLLTLWANFRFYWISMFYGIFLPGGIGADAYKVFYLKKREPERSTLLLTKIMLWDRIIGLVGLLDIALLTAAALLPRWAWLALPLLLLQIPLLRWAIRRWIPAALPVAAHLVVVSLLIQLSQIACILLLMESIGVAGSHLTYVLVFLASSIASMLPVTIGGVGIREMTFLYGAQYLGTSEGYSVTLGLVFDVFVTALALSGGLFLLTKTSKNNVPTAQQAP